MTDAATIDTPPATDRRALMLKRFALVIVVIGIGWALWYLITQRGRVHTDNAYVGADTAQVTPQIAGVVTELRVANTQTVQKGNILLLLDKADAEVELATAQAALLQARQRFAQARTTDTTLTARLGAEDAEIAQAQARQATALSEYDRARQAASRREALAKSGAVSGEELTIARTDLAHAQAALDLARAGVRAASETRASAAGELSVNQVITQGMTGENNPDVAAARARLAAAKLKLERTVIRAPVAGIVTQNQAQVGQQVAPGAALMRIVPVATVFVDGNFKESQLRDVRIGQPVELTSDFYGNGVVFHGRVVGLAAGTGAAFSLIPAQNATGNWVKVVQRLPVRISIDPNDLKLHPLRVGLSMDAIIDTRGK